MVERDSQLSIRRQCTLLGVNRSMFYYVLSGESEENLELMSILDKIHFVG